MYKIRTAALVAVCVLSETRAQLVPDGTPGTAEAENAVASATAGMGECSCDCCQVTARHPSQMVGGTDTQCAVMSLDAQGRPSDACPDSCDNSDLTSTVVSSDSGAMQYSRYCLMTCLPAEADKIGSECRKVTTEEQAQLLTAGGNGKDPASILTPATVAPPAELVDPNAPPEPPQLSDAQALTDADKADSGAAAAAAEGDVVAKKKEKDTGAMVAEASGKQAMAAGIEARITEAEANSAQSLSFANGDMEAAKSGSLMVQSAKAQVLAAEVRAKIFAQSAAKAAKRAQEELKEIQDIPKTVAALAAAEAKRIVQGEVNEAASNVAIVKARMAGPGLPVPLAEAAVRAAQPYYSAMNKAVAMGNLYEANAHADQDAAQSLQEQSRTVAGQAVAYQMAGYGDMANKMMAQAKGMLADSQAKDGAAQQAMSVAEGVRKSLPNYQANAALASARATTLANPGGQPPPALAPKFLQLSSHIFS